MRSIFARCALFMIMSAATGGPAFAGNYRLAAVQADRTPIQRSSNAVGYRIRVCVSPTGSKESKNATQRRIQIGILDDSQPKRSAAELWALYE